MLLSRKHLYSTIRRTVSSFSNSHFLYPLPLQTNYLNFQRYHTPNSIKTGEDGKSNKSEESDDDDDDDHNNLKKLSWKDKFKYLFKKYGKLAIITHFGVYFTTLLITFLSLNYIPVMRSYAGKFIDLVNKYLHLSISNTASGGATAKTNLALTYVLVKFTEPIRLLITIYITRVLYRISKRR